MTNQDVSSHMKHALRLIIAVSLAGVCAAQPPKGIKWIAHRGGVVDELHAENTRGALDAAVAHGYWGIETDIHETKDGKIITNHDGTFGRYYGDPRKVADVTLADALKLRATPGGAPPMSFSELMEACRGRLHLMIDVKGPEHDAAFYEQMERELRRAGLLESAYIIGLPSALRYFRGKARISITTGPLKEAVAKGEDVGRLYFLFEGGPATTEDHVRYANAHQVGVVPTINTFHYGRDMAKSIEQGTADIKRIMSYGVTEFQIDSTYEPAFR